MKDFDVKRSAREVRSIEDRTFRLGGELFVMLDSVPPEALTPADRIREPERDQRECVCGHPRTRHELAKGKCLEGCGCDEYAGRIVKAGSSITETLEAIDETILGLIENGGDGEEAEVRYRAVRARRSDPIQVDDLTDVMMWLMEQQTSRPTGRPASSTGSSSTTGTSLTGDSSLQDSAAA